MSARGREYHEHTCARRYGTALELPITLAAFPANASLTPWVCAGVHPEESYLWVQAHVLRRFNPADSSA
ncbi:hypothetical protein NDU88_002415 [Pleurodeles waltl]|uniref:Uncharacterized protein n=1 Tax=Pleurodeles waltl TaxID=8319 RepID=A0AAV7TKJ7_PLEWA|nr:hypothetical protein NDU88_002415 [Pleurodeles waltl]